MIAPAANGPSRLFAWLLLAALLAISVWLRVQCSRGELWLDEIWTWDISHKLTWPGGLFYQLQEENNHYLNTLAVWLFRDHSPQSARMWFRFPAIVCGVASVAVAKRVAEQIANHEAKQARVTPSQ